MLIAWPRSSPEDPQHHEEDDDITNTIAATTTICRACHQIRSDVVAGLCRPCRGRRAHRHGLRVAPETADQRDALDEIAA